ILSLGVVIGLSLRELTLFSRGDDKTAATAKKPPRLAVETPAAHDPNWECDYPQYQPLGKVLQACPALKPGELPPQDLSVFGGAGRSSFASVDDVGHFDEFYEMCAKQKPACMAERGKYMAQRYTFTGAVT